MIQNDDTISRQAAKEAVRMVVKDLPTRTEINILINDLPTAQPERKTGEWIDEGFYADGCGAHVFRCSECGGHILEYDTDPFCKWCGADMRGQEDE